MSDELAHKGWRCPQCSKTMSDIPKPRASTGFIDPVCVIHGKRMSEHFCCYCCLCFKNLQPEDCNVLPNGQKEDVCKDCAAMERKGLEQKIDAIPLHTNWNNGDVKELIFWLRHLLKGAGMGPGSQYRHAHATIERMTVKLQTKNHKVGPSQHAADTITEVPEGYMDEHNTFQGAGFYFWDETEAYAHGPYTSVETAVQMRDNYFRDLQ